MRQRGQMGILVFAALVGLANCAGAVPELPPSEPPAPTVSPSVSPSEGPGEPDEEVPTPEPLPLPDYPEDLTAEDTPENAILAAEYFLELMNYIQSTGDVAPFEAIAAESCESCARYVKTIRDFYEGGNFSVGNHLHMKEPVAARTRDGGAWEVTSNWEVSTGFQYEASNKKVIERAGTDFEDHRVGVQLIDGEWRMLAFAKASV